MSNEIIKHGMMEAWDSWNLWMVGSNWLHAWEQLSIAFDAWNNAVICH